MNCLEEAISSQMYTHMYVFKQFPHVYCCFVDEANETIIIYAFYQISMALHTEWLNSEHLITKCSLKCMIFADVDMEGLIEGDGLEHGIPPCRT